MFRAGRVLEPHRLPRIVSENENKNHRQIHKIAVDVLDDERERAFADIRFARFADGAVRRVGPERLVIGAAVIITGEPKTRRRPQNQERG